MEKKQVLENKIDKEFIKKHYGENMWKFSREMLSNVLDRGDGVLSEILKKNFAPTHSLYEGIMHDITSKQSFISFINSFIENEEEIKQKSNKKLKEILDEIGYDIFECHTVRELMSYKRYFTEEEMLCTFKEPVERLRNYRIFFLVKKNAEDIKPDKNPSRQDEYGTSVMSVQCTKGDASVISIKNRYNHHVKNPDATYSNNLDNIYKGLKKAFCEEYKIDLIKSQSFCEVEGFVKAKNGKYYKSNMDFLETYICENNVVVYGNGEMIEFNPSNQIVIDNYLIDLEKRIVKDLFMNENEEFSKSLGKIKKISISKDKDLKKIEIEPEEGLPVYIKINKGNQIVSYSNFNLQNVGRNLFYKSSYIRELNIPKVTKIEDNFMADCINLKKLDLPNVEEIGDSCFKFAYSLEDFYAPNLKKMGKECFYVAKDMKKLNLDSVETIGYKSFHNCQNLEALDLPNLTKIGNNVFEKNNNMTEMNLPNLKNIGARCFSNSYKLTNIYAPKVRVIGMEAFYQCNKLKEINLKSLRELRDSSFYYCPTLEKIDMPNLELMGDECFYTCFNLIRVKFPSLKEKGAWCFEECPSLYEFEAPKCEIDNEEDAINEYED